MQKGNRIMHISAAIAPVKFIATRSLLHYLQLRQWPLVINTGSKSVKLEQTLAKQGQVKDDRLYRRHVLVWTSLQCPSFSFKPVTPTPSKAQGSTTTVWSKMVPLHQLYVSLSEETACLEVEDQVGGLRSSVIILIASSDKTESELFV